MASALEIPVTPNPAADTALDVPVSVSHELSFARQVGTLASDKHRLQASLAESNFGIQNFNQQYVQ